jgi:hypothetical protein
VKLEKKVVVGDKKWKNIIYPHRPPVLGIVVVVMATLLLWTVGLTTISSTLPTAALAQPAPDSTCLGRTATIVGTVGNDNIRGTEDGDVIAVLEGDDRVQALGETTLFAAVLAMTSWMVTPTLMWVVVNRGLIHALI